MFGQGSPLLYLHSLRSSTMIHMCAYVSTTLSTTANTDIPALQDDILQIQNNHFIPYADLDVVAAYASSPTLSRTRLNSPRIRQFAPNYIRPLQRQTVPANNSPIDVRFDMPLRVARQEELQMEATSAIAMGNETFIGFVWLSDGIVPAPVQDLYRIRITSTTAGGTNVWTTVQSVYETLLPTGRYAVTDLEYQEANGVAARMIFDNQYFRPGQLAIGASIGNRESDLWKSYPKFVWGYFNTVTLPRIQVMNAANGNAHEFYLTCARIGPA